MSGTAAPLVEIRDLHFSYGANRIFRGLSLSVPRGGMIAILGASGSGKSTLLRLIGGQARPARGSVAVEGRVVHELDSDALYAMRRRMGMMFQVSGLFSDLTVFENVAFPLREHYNLPEELIHSMVLMKLQAVGLRGAHALKPADLSGGMSRRVALARAIAIDPMIAMYDEPFAGLDPISLNAIAQLIRKSTDALGSTSIVVTYNVGEALQMVDYIYVIAEGVVAGHGTPQALLASDDPFIRQFLNALPDGPVRFHFPGKPLFEDVGLTPEAYVPAQLRRFRDKGRGAK